MDFLNYKAKPMEGGNKNGRGIIIPEIGFTTNAGNEYNMNNIR